MEVSKEVLNYLSFLIPSGLDGIERAIDMAKRFGEDEKWAAEALIKNAKYLGFGISELNPIHSIYLEIGASSFFEFSKLATDGEVYVDDTNIIVFDDSNESGFGISDEFVVNMQKIVREKNIKRDDISIKLQSFLDGIGVKLD